jgi:hypothetical protein
MLADVLSGAVAFGLVMCSLFFLRFWKRTADALFLAFSISFSLLALTQVIVVTANMYKEDNSVAYLIRLAAFSLLIVAIWRKNRRGGARD